jgi:hypothetical protein
MHTNALTRNAKSYVLYYKDVLDILTHPPLVEPYAKANTKKIINQNNYTFITHHKLMELNAIQADYFFYYSKMGKGFDSGIRDHFKIIANHKENLSNDNEEEKIKAFFFAIFKVINKLTNYYSTHSYR